MPPSGDLPNPEIESRFPTLQVDSLPSELPGNPTEEGKKLYILVILKNNFIYLFLAVLGLHCCIGFYSFVVSRGYSLALWLWCVGFSLWRHLLL